MKVDLRGLRPALLFFGEVEFSGEVGEAAFGPGPFFGSAGIDGARVSPDLSGHGSPSGAAGSFGQQATESEGSEGRGGGW